MPDLSSIVSDTFPAHEDQGVPLKSTITITFDAHLDPTSATDAFFLEGPDTDQFVGPDLELLLTPDNISQGTDLLESPVYQGIVQGTAALEIITSGVSTKLTFTPDQPLAAQTTYTAHITDITGHSYTSFSGLTYSGHLYFTFVTGTGSIEEVPTTVSTSVLTSLNQSVSLASLDPMEVAKTSPEDRAIEQKVDLGTIEVEFSKEIDSASVLDDEVVVKALPATDHPSNSEVAYGELAKTVTIEGKKLIIKI